MGQYTISPKLRALYARQRELMDQVHLATDERRELGGLPDRIGDEWVVQRARKCLERQGPPRTITTGPSPLDQAYGDR